MHGLLLYALLQSLPTSAPASVTPHDPDGQTIVVVGNRIQMYRDRLAACLARNCPADEDIDATTALAEALFIVGQYRDARTTLRASISRNHDQALRYPEPVSDLYRANARVARHLGFDVDAQRSTREILRSLRTGIAVEDHRHFTARLEIAESLLAFGHYRQSRHELDDLAKAARRAGREDIATVAELRALWVDHLEFPSGDAVRDLLEWAQSPDPRRSIGAKMLLIRIYSERGDSQRANALMVELGHNHRRRQLLYSPPYELLIREGKDGRNPNGSIRSLDTTLGRIAGNVEDQWIDVGFWIQPDGRVSDMQIVRSDGSQGWAGPLLKSINGRRYSTTDGDEPTYRLERYTYTSGYEDRTGSRTRQRSPRARVEYFDLMSGAPAPSRSGS
jgi:hypothetical protein